MHIDAINDLITLNACKCQPHLTTKFHWSMPYIKVSKDGFDGSPPMLSSLPAALASPSRALYSIRFSRFSPLHTWIFRSFNMFHFNPLHLDNLEFISPNFIPFSSIFSQGLGSLKFLWIFKAAAVWTVRSLGGWSSSEGSSRKVFLTMALVMHSLCQSAAAKGVQLDVVSIDWSTLLHGFMEVSVPHAMHCREFLSSGPQSSDSASCSERWAPCGARAPQASRNDANAWSGDESFSCKGKWKSGWAQLRSMATNFIACECLMCFSNLMAVKCHKAYWAYCVPLSLSPLATVATVATWHEVTSSTERAMTCPSRLALRSRPRPAMSIVFCTARTTLRTQTALASSWTAENGDEPLPHKFSGHCGALQALSVLLILAWARSCLIFVCQVVGACPATVNYSGAHGWKKKELSI